MTKLDSDALSQCLIRANAWGTWIPCQFLRGFVYAKATGPLSVNVEIQVQGDAESCDRVWILLSKAGYGKVEKKIVTPEGKP